MHVRNVAAGFALPVLATGLLTALVAGLVAGCSKPDPVPGPVDVKHGSPQAVAPSIGATRLKFMPGRWETTVEMTRFDTGKELPPQARDMMKQMMAKTRKLAACLTPEQAEKPGPEFFGEQRSGCTYDHFTMGSGTIDAKLVCTGKGGGEGGDNGAMTMTMTGHYTAQSYDMKVSSNGTQGGLPIAMDLAMTAHHTGACIGTELK